MNFVHSGKLLILITLISLVACQNNDKTSEIESEVEVEKRIEVKEEVLPYNLNGTWVSHDKHGSSIIKINGSSDIQYSLIVDRGKDSPDSSRYYYYESSGLLGSFHEPSDTNFSVDIFISTDQFRFDFKIKDDIMYEVDKMGIQRTYHRIKE